MSLRFILMFALVGIVSGCVELPEFPKTAEEFRQAAASGGSRYLTVEKFEVDRPYRMVAKTFEHLSDACLRVQIATTSLGGYGSGPSRFYQTFKPTVKVNKRRAEFYIQYSIGGSKRSKVYTEADGNYVMVVDAYPAGRDRTRIELHRGTVGLHILFNSVRDWATGKSTACPDLTKVGR